jgi:putative DNA primase/helicase
MGDTVMSIRTDTIEKSDVIMAKNSPIVGEDRVKSIVTVKAAYQLRGKNISDKKYKELCDRMDKPHTDDEVDKIFNGVKAVVGAIKAEEDKERELKDAELPDYLYYDDKGNLKIEMMKYSRHLQKTLNIIYYPTAHQLFTYDNNAHCYRSETTGKEIDKSIVKMLEERSMDSSHLTYISDQITKHLKSMDTVEEYPFNNSKNTLPVENGILEFDYKKGDTRLLPHGPQHRFDYVMGASWNSDVSCDKAKNLIRTWVKEENVNDIIQVAAQALVQKQLCQQMKRATLIVGLPNTGKSKCKKLITSTMGVKYISSLSLQDIAGDRFANGSLERSTINFVDDMDSVALTSVSKFKDLTGDATTHDIERKGVEKYSGGKIMCGWCFTCNFPPSVTERVKRDSAFWQRWNVVYFENVFSGVNTKFEEDTYTPELRSSFLKCITEMIIKIHQNGTLVSEHSIDDVMTKWLSKCDTITDFIDNGGFTPVESGGQAVYYIKSKLFEAYQKQSVRSGFTADQILQSKPAFNTSMQNHGFLQIRKDILVGENRVTHECFKSWLKPAGEIKSDGNYYMKEADGDKFGVINEIGTCLFDYLKVDTSSIIPASSGTGCVVDIN